MDLVRHIVVDGCDGGHRAIASAVTELMPLALELHDAVVLLHQGAVENVLKFTKVNFISSFCVVVGIKQMRKLVANTMCIEQARERIGAMN